MFLPHVYITEMVARSCLCLDSIGRLDTALQTSKCSAGRYFILHKAIWHLFLVLKSMVLSIIPYGIMSIGYYVRLRYANWHYVNRRYAKWSRTDLRRTMCINIFFTTR